MYTYIFICACRFKLTSNSFANIFEKLDTISVEFFFLYTFEYSRYSLSVRFTRNLLLHNENKSLRMENLFRILRDLRLREYFHWDTEKSRVMRISRNFSNSRHTTMEYINRFFFRRKSREGYFLLVPDMYIYIYIFLLFLE